MLSARNLPRSALGRISRRRRPSPPPLPRPPTPPPPQPLPPRPTPRFDPLLSRDLEHLGTNRTRVPPSHATSNVKSRFGIGTKHISELPEVNLARYRSRMDTIGTCDAFCRLQMCGGKRETTVSPSEPLFFPCLSRSRSRFRFLGLSRALSVVCLCLIPPTPASFPSSSFTDTVSTQTAFPKRGSVLSSTRINAQHSKIRAAARGRLPGVPAWPGTCTLAHGDTRDASSESARMRGGGGGESVSAASPAVGNQGRRSRESPREAIPAAAGPRRA